MMENLVKVAAIGSIVSTFDYLIRSAFFNGHLISAQNDGDLNILIVIS